MKAVFVCFMISVATAAPPDPAKFSPVEGGRAAQILDQFAAARHRGGTFSADVTETKYLRILNQPVTSRGHVDFSPPSRFRFELLDPTRSVTVFNGEELWMHYSDFDETEHYTMRGPAQNKARQAIAPILSTFGEQVAEWQKFYKVTTSETPDWYLFELTPNRPPLSQQLTRIRLWVQRKDFVLGQFELVTVNGDRTVSEFNNAVVGRPIPEDTFRWTGANQKR